MQPDIEDVAGFVFFENSSDASVKSLNRRLKMRKLSDGIWR